MKKAIYINSKNNSLFTNDDGKIYTVFAEFVVKTDKKGRQYIIAECEKKTSAKGNEYFQVVKNDRAE